MPTGSEWLQVTKIKQATQPANLRGLYHSEDAAVAGNGAGDHFFCWQCERGHFYNCACKQKSKEAI